MTEDRYHKILFLLVLVQIIASFGSIVIWYTQPDMRMTLVVPYTDASIVAAVVGVLAIVALIGIRMNNKWAPVLVIILTVSSRVVGLMHFELSIAQAVFAVWSTVLVIVSIMNYMETS
jgi:hypothetical protein